MLRRPFEFTLATTIGVMQQRIRLAAPPWRHQQRIGDELCAVMAALIDQPATWRENRSSTAAT